MKKVRVWLDDYYLYMEAITSNGNILTHEEYGNVKPFNREYANRRIAYLWGDAYTIEYVE